MNFRNQSRGTRRWMCNSMAVAAATILTLLGGGWTTTAAISDTEVTATPSISSDTPLAHDPSVGAVVGESSTEGGAASYRIPITVPPGRAGLQPNVALTYNSRSGNGIAGMGWSLSASSAIQRCPQTMEQDGGTRGVNYDNEDRLCLEGQRLLRVAGSAYGVSGAEYRTEIDSFARITQIGGGLTGASTCFTVEQKSGRVLHYGAVALGGTCLASSRNARAQPSGAVATLSWLVEKDEDRLGNNVFYSYINFGNGEILSSQIDYTGFGTVVGDRSVRMVYELRPTSASAVFYHADIASNYLAGGLTLQTRRLKRVETYESASSIVSSWKLDYQNTTSRYSGRSLLRSINQCSTAAGIETCLSKPTTFDWQDRSPFYAIEALTFPGLPQSAWTALDAQIASQALEDLHEDQLLELNAAGSHDPARPSDLPITPLNDTALGSVLGFSTIADFDGDGARESFARIYTNSGTRGFLIQAMPNRTVRSVVDITGQTVSPNENANEVGDIDGDGRAEILAYTNPLTFGAWNAAPGALPGSPVYRAVSTTIPSGGLGAIQFRARLADFNGDGKPDIATVAANGSCGSDGLGNKNGVFIHRNNLLDGPVGNTAAFVQSTTPLFCLARAASGSLGELGEYVERIADFNGDGLPDFFIAKSSGATGATVTFERIVLTRYSGGAFTYSSLPFAAIGLSNEEHLRTASRVAHWIDINGDGLDDFVFGQSEGSIVPTGVWLVRLNQGAGSLSASINTGNSAGLISDQSVLRYANRLPQMDIDSDGRVDLLTPRSFAARICAYSTRAPSPNTECPGGVTRFGQCVEYLCPEAPGSATLNMGGITYGNQQIKALYGQGQGGLDQSSYTLNALRFVQTGPSTIAVQEVPTNIMASLDRQAPEDTYGDSIPDLITTVGCKFASSGFGGEGFEPCLLVNDGIYGPNALPNGDSLQVLNPGNASYYFENHNAIYINEGLGSLNPEFPEDVGPLTEGSPRVGDFIQNMVDGLDDATSWRYRPLAAAANYQSGLPFYNVPAIAAERYSDARHYYFTSTMSVVQAMTKSTAAIDKIDPTLAFGGRSWFYAYKEAMYNRLGRGFQGFRSIVELSVLPTTRGTQITTTFHQKFPLTGMVESVDVAPANKTAFPISRETTTWRCGRSNRAACPTAPAIPQTTVFAPFLDTQVTQNFDLAATQANTTSLVSTQTTVNAISNGASSSGWDTYGNLLNQVVTRTDGVAGGSFVQSHGTTTTNNYTVDPNIWWIDKLDNISVTSSIVYASGHALPASCPALTCTPPRTVATSYEWNPDRTPQSQTLQSGVGNQQSGTTYVYPNPSYGLPTSITMSAPGASPASRATTISYSKDGTTVAVDGYFPLQTTNALFQTTTTERRRRDGQVSRLITPTLLQTVTQFDPFGRPIRIDYKRTDGVTALEPSAYISLARCTEARGGTLNSVPAWCPSGYGEGEGEDLAVLRTTIVKDGQPTQVTWQDKLGRTVKLSTRSLTGAFVQNLTEFDVAGSVDRQSTPHFAGGTAYWTSFDSYDHLARPSSKTAPAAEMDYANGDVVTKYTYTGTKTAIKVRGSNTSSTGACQANVLCMDMERYYDSLGHLVKTVQNNGPTANYATSRYWFDAAGNPVAAQDAEGNVIRGYYDALGRRTSMADPDSGTWAFLYDGFGQMVGQVDARGVATSMAYDVLGRMTNRNSSNPGGAGLAAETVYDSWVFDPVGGPGQLDFARRGINSALAQVWKEQYGYNATTRRPESINTTIAGEPATWVTTQSYDSAGREQVTTYPDGLSIQRNYHPSSGIFNQLANANTSQEYWASSVQDAFGNIVNENYGNGVYTNDVSYASTGQMLFKRWYTSTGAPLDQFQYTYDSFGNLKQQQRTQVVEENYPVTESYTYDGLQRLTESNRGAIRSQPPVYTSYGPSGNLLKKSDNGANSPGAYQYGSNGCGPHAVASVQKDIGIYRTYGCDANGNVVAGNEINAVYDFMNLPRIVNRVGGPHTGSTQFRYDANGQRYEEVTGSGETTRFGPKGYEKVISPGSAARHRHELGPVIVKRSNGVDDVTYVGRDRLGSTVSVLPNNPYKSALKSYDPFGKPREGNFTDNGKTTEAGRLLLRPLTARGYTGHEHIDEGRVIHMNGRVYDYALGRFLGPDPVIQSPTNTQSLNPYSYILNNPFAGTDPSGFATCASSEVASESACAEVGVHTVVGGDGKKTSLIVGEKGDNIAISGTIDVKKFIYISATLNLALNPRNGADSWVKNGPNGGVETDKIKSASGRGKGCNGEISCYFVKRDERGDVASFERASSVNSRFAAINGMLNSVGYALQLMSNHVNTRYHSDNLTMVYNPTERFFRDAIESSRDKFGGTTLVTKAFANVLASTGSRTSWVAHSQGGIIFSEAVRYNLNRGIGSLSNHSVSFDSGANNAWVTNRYLVRAGISLDGRGYYDAPNDLVPQIIGLRAWNRPDRVLMSIISAPLLFTSSSPHTNAQP